MIALLVGVGALVGAPLRYWTDRLVRSRHDGVLPWGTLIVNVVASLVLGGLAGAVGHVSEQWSALVGTGFCGALSTYSTFGYENQRLVVDGERAAAVVNVVLSLVLGVGAAALGWALGAALV